MRKFILLLFILFVQADLHGQVLNSWSADSSGFYYHSIDTLIKRIKAEKKLSRVVVITDELHPHEDLPDTIAGVPVDEFRRDDFNSKDLATTDIYLDDFGLQVNKDAISISFIVFHRPKKSLQTYGDGEICFYYKYQPDLKSYKLEQINEIFVMIHFYKKR